MESFELILPIKIICTLAEISTLKFYQPYQLWIGLEEKIWPLLKFMKPWKTTLKRRSRTKDYDRSSNILLMFFTFGWYCQLVLTIEVYTEREYFAVTTLSSYNPVSWDLCIFHIFHIIIQRIVIESTVSQFETRKRRGRKSSLSW